MNNNLSFIPNSLTNIQSPLNLLNNNTIINDAVQDATNLVSSTTNKIKKFIPEVPNLKEYTFRSLPELPFGSKTFSLGIQENKSLPFVTDNKLFNFPLEIPFFKVGELLVNLNLIRSPPIQEQKKYKTYLSKLAGAPVLPKRLILFDNINYDNPVKFQTASTCVANSSALMKEYHEKIDSNYSKKFSPEFIYLQRSNKPSDGMYLENAMEILKNIGACPLESYPSIELSSSNEIPKSSFDTANNYRISEYKCIYQQNIFPDPNPQQTINDLKSALFLNGPCLIAFNLYNFYGIFDPVTKKYDGRIWVKANWSQPATGGHCMTVVGYDDDKKAFLIRNSWGPNWNYNGHTWYPYSDFGTKYEALEIWTSIDVKNSPQPITSSSIKNFIPLPPTDNVLNYSKLFKIDYNNDFVDFNTYAILNNSSIVYNSDNYFSTIQEGLNNLDPVFSSNPKAYFYLSTYNRFKATLFSDYNGKGNIIGVSNAIPNENYLLVNNWSGSMPFKSVLLENRKEDEVVDGTPPSEDINQADINFNSTSFKIFALIIGIIILKLL